MMFSHLKKKSQSPVFFSGGGWWVDLCLPLGFLQLPDFCSSPGSVRSPAFHWFCFAFAEDLSLYVKVVSCHCAAFSPSVFFFSVLVCLGFLSLTPSFPHPLSPTRFSLFEFFPWPWGQQWIFLISYTHGLWFLLVIFLKICQAHGLLVF